MRIAVIGAGGIGAIYGASLAKAGADVVFVARGAHLAAMRENGLRIEGDRGEIHVRPAQATDDIASIGIVDYVLFAVKFWDVESAGEQIRPIVGPATAVIPLQNGVDAAERLAAILGPEPVMGGTAFVTGSIVAPGIVRQTGTYQQMTFGELDGGTTGRGRAAARSLPSGRVRRRAEPRCQGADLGEIPAAGAAVRPQRVDPPAARQMARRLRSLGAVRGHVARDRRRRPWPRGCALPPDSADKTLATMWSMPDHHMTSMGNDLARGNRLELPWFAGKVVELGRRHGVPTPANAFIYTALKPYANGAPA